MDAKGDLIPVSKQNQAYMDLEYKYGAQNYHSFPIVVESGT